MSGGGKTGGPGGSRKVTRAIFPMAGLGTRFLPATKSVPKEIMTLVDRPLVQYAIDEARAAGITDFVFVTSRGKGALEDYFDQATLLEQTLQERDQTELLETLRATNMESGAVAYIRQREPLGLGHAVWCAHRLVAGDEPFAVMLPDDVIAGDRPCLQQMVEAYEETGGCMVATMEVPRDRTSSYGILDIGESGEVGSPGQVMKVGGMVEKPDPAEAPSCMAVIGRYILTPEVMASLERRVSAAEKGVGGEIQLTDAIAEQIGSSEGVHACHFNGTRFDCGNRGGYVQATIALALQNPDLGDELRERLRAMADEGAF